MKTKLNVSGIPKGKDKTFAAGGRTKMFGAGDRVKSKFPAEPQKPGRTGQHAPQLPKVRSPAINAAGDMGGSAGASMPRRPA
jgi:hypothetical protein